MILIQIFLTISWWAKMHVLAPVGPQLPVPRDHAATTLHKEKKCIFILQLVGEWLLEVAVGEIGCKLSNFLKNF